MKRYVLNISLALLLAAFLWGCQEQASNPVGSEDPGIIPLGKVHFDCSVYELVDTPLDWKSAKKEAKRMAAPGCKKAHLATITSQDEQDFLTDLMAGSEHNAWIGGRQGGLSLEENWHWITGEPWVYTYWTLNEPNDDAGPGSEQHLEALTGEDNPAGAWNDAPGFEEKYFVVESEHCNCDD
jgi:hypothetical protein